MTLPKIVISRCFIKPVRYDGTQVADPFVTKLLPYIEILDICPEVGMGLSIPRKKIVVLLEGGEKRLLQPETGIDFTSAMQNFTQETLKGLSDVDGFLLKAKSPSCGVGSTKLYQNGRVIKKTFGFFAEAIRKTFPYLPLEDEGRLKDTAIRAHFLTKIFAFAEARQLSTVSEPNALIQFHTKYKFLLLTYNQRILRELGKLVADSKVPLPEKISLYQKKFWEAFLKKPSLKRHLNTIWHIYGFFSKKINSKEKKHFYHLIEKYSRGMVSHQVIIELLKNMAYRFNEEYLIHQKYLQPYPEELEAC